MLFPWDYVSRAGFSDFENYVEDYNYYASIDLSALEHYEITGPIGFFIREPLWYELVRYLTIITGEAAIALRLLSFCIVFVWGYFLLRRTSLAIAALFLLNPTAIDVAMSGIRNGLAWSLVIIGLTARSARLRTVLFVVGSLIHTSTLVLFALYFATQRAAGKIGGKGLAVIGIASGLAVGLALTVASELVLGALGDRRVGDEYVVGGGSLLQASVWAALLYFQCTSNNDYVRRNVFVIAVIAWYQTMNPFVPWSFRIWGSFLPVIAVSALDLSPQKRQWFFFAYIGYLVIQYVYWTPIFYLL